jgi:hypothetical protein
MALMTNMMRKRKLNELIASWVEYRDTIARHAGQGEATPEQERRFLELKATIAARLPLLNEFSTGHGTVNQELAANVRGMTDLMNRYLTLNSNGAFDEKAREEFMSKWHSHFLFMNRFKELPGHAPQQRSRLTPAPVSGSSPYSTWGGRRLVSGIFDNWVTRFAVRAAVVIILVVIAARLTNFDFANAGDSAKRIYNEWWGPSSPPQVAAAITKNATKTHAGTIDQSVNASSTGQVPAEKATTTKKKAGNVVMIGPGSENRGKHSVDGTGAFKAPEGPNPLHKAVAFIRDITPRPLREFMSPVTQQWGVEATIAFVGVGLLLVAYMLFGRAR